MNAAYVLAFATLLVTFGRLGDLLKQGLVFPLGMAVFLGASAVAGLAHRG
jgi:MFS family permease